MLSVVGRRHLIRVSRVRHVGSTSRTCFFETEGHGACPTICDFATNQTPRAMGCAATDGVLSPDISKVLLQVMATHEQELKNLREDLVEAREDYPLMLIGDLCVWTRDTVFDDTMYAALSGTLYLFNDELPGHVEGYLPGIADYVRHGLVPDPAVRAGKASEYLENFSVFQEYMTKIHEIDVATVYLTIDEHDGAMHTAYPNYMYPINHPYNTDNLLLLLEKADSQEPFEDPLHEKLKTRLQTALRKQYKAILLRRAAVSRAEARRGGYER